MTTILRSPVFWRARHYVRKWSDTHVDRPIARTLAVGTALRRGKGDVLYLGDSSLIHISHGDTDRRRLGEMLEQELDTQIAKFYAPGTSVNIFNEIARLIVDLPRPRCVVVSMNIRNSSHLVGTRHPMWGWQHAAASMRDTARFGPALATKLYRSPPTPEDYARFDALPHVSEWGIADTIGAYRKLLKGYHPHTADEQQRRTIYDYFHGEYNTDSPGVHDWRTLGERLAVLGVPVIGYRTIMPLEAGTRLLGERFAPHVEEEFRLIEEQFLAGLGGNGMLVEQPLMPDSGFVDWADGTEHLNQEGRRRVVDALAPAIRKHL